MTLYLNSPRFPPEINHIILDNLSIDFKQRNDTILLEALNTLPFLKELLKKRVSIVLYLPIHIRYNVLRTSAVKSVLKWTDACYIITEKVDFKRRREAYKGRTYDCYLEDFLKSRQDVPQKTLREDVDDFIHVWDINKTLARHGKERLTSFDKLQRILDLKTGYAAKEVLYLNMGRVDDLEIAERLLEEMLTSGRHLTGIKNPAKVTQFMEVDFEVSNYVKLVSKLQGWRWRREMKQRGIEWVKHQKDTNKDYLAGDLVRFNVFRFDQELSMGIDVIEFFRGLFDHYVRILYVSEVLCDHPSW